MLEWFDEMSIEKPDWLAKSRDLNPIEHLWDELICQLQARHLMAVTDLTNALMEYQMAITIAMYRNLVESLPIRVKTMIAAKGLMFNFVSHLKMPKELTKQIEASVQTLSSEDHSHHQIEKALKTMDTTVFKGLLKILETRREAVVYDA